MPLASLHARPAAARIRHDASVDATLGDAVNAMRAARAAWRVRKDEGRNIDSFPSRRGLVGFVETLSAALYPRRLGGYRGSEAAEDGFVAAKLIATFVKLEREAAAEFAYWQQEASGAFDADQAATAVRLFDASLGEIRRLVDSDVEAAFLADPAARSVG